MATQNYKTCPRAYISWSHMKARCNNKNDKRWEQYGGRGIKYCKEWEHFSNFVRDMGDRPLGLTLDRIDNDGDYCKQNCRWTDAKTQLNNTTRNKRYFLNGVSKTLSQWIEHFGLKPSTVRQRFYVYHWSLEKSLKGTPWQQ